MGRNCESCDSPRRGELDAVLRSQARPPIRDLAERFGLKKSGLDRHARAHVARAKGVHTADAPAGLPPERAPGELDTLPDPTDSSYGAELAKRAHRLIEVTEKSGTYRDATSALRLALESHEKQLKRIASLPPAYAPERDAVLAALRAKVIGALRDCPACLEACRKAFDVE